MDEQGVLCALFLREKRGRQEEEEEARERREEKNEKAGSLNKVHSYKAHPACVSLCAQMDGM